MDWNKAEEKINFVDRLAGDKVVWMIVLFLCLISMVSIFSSTSQLATESNTRLDIVFEQFRTILGGLFCIFIIYKCANLRILRFFSKFGFVVSLLMLIFLDLHIDMGFVKAASFHDSWRIIKVGGLQVHIFEVIKVAMTMYLSWAVEYYRNGKGEMAEKLGSFEQLKFLKTERGKKIFYIYGPIILTGVLLLPGGNSNAVFTGGLMVVTVLLAGMPFKDILRLMLAGVCALSICIGIYYLSGKTCFTRLGTALSGSRFGSSNEERFNETTKGTAEYRELLDKIMQPVGAKLAIKTGRLFGKGPGNSTQKFVVPIIYEDYIFCFIIEEYGLFVGIFVIFLYISLLARGSLIARNCEDDFARCAIGGLSVLITAQAMMHIVVNCDLGVRTGQTLPLISYGKSSFLCFSVAFGIILSISRITSRKIAKEEANAESLMALRPDDIRDSMDDLDAYETDDSGNIQ